MQIVTINGGSSSVKWALFDGNVQPRSHWRVASWAEVGEVGQFLTERILDVAWSHEVEECDYAGSVRK